MDRRQALAAGGAFALLGGSAAAAPADLKTAAMEAWLYCLPLIEMATTRGRAIGAGPPPAPGQANAFTHARQLAGPRSRAVTAPNNDTLYSSAWLDLSAGPIGVTLPAAGARYFSLALMDMFTNNFAVLGARTTGQQGGAFTLVGPTAPAPAGAIRSPTPWVWALGRTLVDGPDDLPAARAAQDGLLLDARPGRTPPRGPGRAAAWNEYFLWAQQLLGENPPPATDTAFFQRIASLQLGPRRGFERARFADTEVADIEAGIIAARAALRAQPQRIEGGWTYPRANQGDYGQDYRFRAAVALGGLAALPPEEAIYLRPIGPDGRAVFTEGAWRLALPGPLPVDGFWSLTLYEATAEGQFFLTDNPLSRYAIGDRTRGLVRGPAGEIDIWIARDDPGGARTANWLPAPAQGPFAMSLRAYLPRAELLDGRYRLPPLERTDLPPPAPQETPEPAPPPTPRRRRRRRRR